MGDLTDGLADFIGLAGIAEAIGLALRQFGFDIEAHEPNIEAVAQHLGHATDGARLAVQIEQGDIAFRRAVKLDDAGDFEPALEVIPNFGPHAIAKSHLDLVLGFIVRVGRRRRVHQVATQLTNIYDMGNTLGSHVAPEGRGREFTLERKRCSVEEGGPDAAKASRCVIEGQHAIELVGRLHVGEARKGLHVHLGTCV